MHALTMSCISESRLFGTTDNYNTEYTEQLHIDLAKEAYRSTNFKDELPQMTLWLERKEKKIGTKNSLNGSWITVRSNRHELQDNPF
jgi:hypothetical protein